MKIAMKKCTPTPKDVALSIGNVHLQARLFRVDSQMLRLEGNISGELELTCDVSGEDYTQRLDYPLVLYIADGLWSMQSQSKKLDSFEVIEFFDGFVDLHYILESEIESIKSDYHTKD